jgi:tripartite-type tricarboxylate transporter receptor subunit TctC
MKRLLTAAAACGLLGAGAAHAAEPRPYPAKPVRMVVPFGPGSISDILARTVSARLSESFGQQVVVDNRPGAGGNIGADLVAKAPADGYTLLLGAASVLAINSSLFANVPFDQATAFAHITQVSSNTNVLVVNPSLPVRSVKELIAYGKANPGKLTFASSGAGGSIHLSGELFKAMAGIDMVHVAYKSSPLAHVDLIGGQVQLMFDGMPTAIPQIKAGKLRALGVTAAKRSALMPELPTIAEAGLPGYEAVGWFGFAAPAGTPRPVVAKLNQEIVRVLNLPDVRERLLGIGAEPVGSSPEAFSRFVKTEMAKWGKIVKALNLKLD